MQFLFFIKYMSAPFFSVIVPTYNRADFISEAIKSVLAQTFREFELIIVDDGSTDNTKEVIEPFLSDRRVKYIYQENNERAAARNNGIKNASGEWIAFLDSDDIWLPKHLKECFNRINQINIPVLIYGLSYIVDVNGTIISKIKNKRIEGYVFEEIIKKGHTGFANSSVCVHKSIFNDVGLLNEDRNLSGSEDSELWDRIALQYPFYSTGQYTVKLRHHIDQTMVNPVKMEQAGKKKHEIIFSKTQLGIAHLKKISTANLYLWFGINYYASGKMSDARMRLFKAIKEDKKILLTIKWWWTFVRTFLPARTVKQLRHIKFLISEQINKKSEECYNQNQLGVCILVTRHLPHVGGIEKQAHLLSKELVKVGITVFALTRNYYNMKKDEIIDGVYIHRVTLLGKSSWLASLSYISGSLLWLLKNKKRYKVIIGFQAYSPMTIGVITKIILGKPVIVSPRCGMSLNEFNELEHLPFYGIRKYLLSKVDKFLALSTEVSKEIGNHDISKDKIVVIPNGVHIIQECSYIRNHKLNAKKNLSLKEDEKIVVFTGRLAKEKGLDILVRAWYNVIKQIKAKLFIVGDEDTDRSIALEIKRITNQLALQDSIIFTGFKKDVTNYLVASDVFVFPSRAELMSNSLLEAMAAGCAIVASDIEPNKELITDNINGLLFPVDNEYALSEKIIQLLTNTLFCEKLGKKAKEITIERYSIDAVTKQHINLYQELIK